MNNKILLSTDWHFGKSDGKFDQIIYDGIKELCDYAIQNKITTMINLGDTFDLKQEISTTTLNFIHKSFELLNTTFNKIYVIVGNHDMQKKIYNGDGHNIHILDAYTNVILIDYPQVISIFDKKFFMIPYLPTDILSKMDFIDADYCMGHFEVKGFMLNSFVKSEEGIESKGLFSKYKHTFLGHFHKKQTYKNISYIGNLCRFFYGENDEERGWTILDCESSKQTFIEYQHQNLYKFKLTELVNRYDDLETIFKKGDKLKLILDTKLVYSDLEELKKLLLIDLEISDLIIEEQYFQYEIDDFVEEEDEKNILNEDSNYLELCKKELEKIMDLDEEGQLYINEKIKNFQN